MVDNQEDVKLRSGIKGIVPRSTRRGSNSLYAAFAGPVKRKLTNRA
jgi:hypothetical protein